ncbi:hypothetical protein FOXYS1_8904 [Fusarium oxysporum]|uniref:Rhodopsin domain-containing protein n=1 Tax=Fusarium oxysporum TaxID=5507 RepID=A0A8H5A878_FUSOX|nr:hypothetical protein FOXYS1_8904 [Fusarium oxysporum]
MAASDYVSESRSAVAIAVMATLSSISLIVVSLRVYARAIMLRNFGVDDACAILACLLTIADASIIATNVRNGLGSHISTLSGEQISNFLRMFYFSTVVYNLALAVIKTIFLLQYYRAIPVRQYKKTYITSVVLVTCWSLSQIFLNTFMCVPIASFWDVTIKGTCILNKSSFYVGAAGNILTDILIMALPIPVLRSLKLGRRQKWILMSVFCLGIFTCLISLVRIKFLNIGTDITWHNVESASWSVSELCCGIICACVPTLRPLLSGHERGSSHDQSSYARHENSRGIITARQTGTSRSHEMNDLPRTLHSSESKDQLRPLESTIVVRTDVDQKRGRPQPGHGPVTHQLRGQNAAGRQRRRANDSNFPPQTGGSSIEHSPVEAETGSANQLVRTRHLPDLETDPLSLFRTTDPATSLYCGQSPMPWHQAGVLEMDNEGLGIIGMSPAWPAVEDSVLNLDAVTLPSNHHSASIATPTAGRRPKQIQLRIFRR